jgi:ornithine cyclodeaminase/alanine dehydrogenase-like protein (mu-crystallin family)
VHPRQAESFAHAMPAFVRGEAADGSSDLLGIKWVTGFPENRDLGLPAIHAAVLLTDPRTGQLRALIDGAPITTQRTAAVTGLAIETWRPSADPRTLRVALIGAGVQARGHLPVLGHFLPGSSIVITDLHADRANALAEDALATGTFSAVAVARSATDAVSGAHVVVSVASFGPDRQSVPAAAFADALLVVAVDYDMVVPASLASSARTFAVDERGQFLANRATGIFDGYPDPGTTIGETLLAGGGSPGVAAPSASGTVLVTHLGVGVADLVFADAVLNEAQRLGLGTRLAA